MYRLKQWFIHFKRNLNFGIAAPSEFIADNRKKGRKVAFSSTKRRWRPLRGALFFKAISLWALEAVTVETVSKRSSILCLCVELCDNFMCPFSCPTHRHTRAEISRWSDGPWLGLSSLTFTVWVRCRARLVEVVSVLRGAAKSPTYQCCGSVAPFLSVISAAHHWFPMQTFSLRTLSCQS